MSIESTLAERGARYGNFADHAEIAQALQDTLRATAGWVRLAADQRQALTVIADKIARMLNGDPDYVDNWHDIIGYARLVEQRLEATVTEAAPLDDSEDGDEPCAPPLPVSDETVRAVAKNCIRLTQHLLEANARLIVANRHALKLGENVAGYVRAHFHELDDECRRDGTVESLRRLQTDNESRN